jgi:hypothetical protein
MPPDSTLLDECRWTSVTAVAIGALPKANRAMQLSVSSTGQNPDKLWFCTANKVDRGQNEGFRTLAMSAHPGI